MEIMEVKNYEEMSKTAASLIIEKIKKIDKPVLGLATGSTPGGLYDRIIEMYQQNHASFEHVTTYNLDEYVGLERNHPNSYHYYMNDKLFKHIDIPTKQTHIPQGNAADLEKECHDYEESIHNSNYIDIQILGLGINGHIGFNEPGTPFSSLTHTVTLDESTRKANARFFASIDDVPTQAITMGLKTIMKSKEIILLVSGGNKAEPLSRFLNGELSEDFPASILHKHHHVTIIADYAALWVVKEKEQVHL